MVCGGGAQIRQRIELIDTSCVMQDVLHGGYQLAVPAPRAAEAAAASPDAGAGPSRVPAKFGQSLTLPGTLDADVKRDVLHLIAMKVSQWMYTAESGSHVEPPQAAGFVLRNGQVLKVSFAPLQVTLSDAWVQEQFAILMVTVEGRSLVPPLRVLVLGFRGTARAQDVLGNVSPLVNEQAFARYGLNVHAAWHSLVAQQRHVELLWATLDEAAQLGATELLVTGHSMGGALGQISALQVLAKLDAKASEDAGQAGQLSPGAERLVRTVACVSFGAPMPFVPEAPERLSVALLHAQRRALQWLATRTLNYVNNNDVVPRLPGCIDFLRDVLKTIRPATLVYKFGLSVLEGSPVIRRYRPVSRVSMVGHTEVPTGHARLGLEPTSPECARAMMTRYASDTYHDDCPVRGPLTGCRLVGWMTGGSFFTLKDHLMERYEGYVLTAIGAKELCSSNLVQKLGYKMGYLNREFRVRRDGPPIMGHTKSTNSGKRLEETVDSSGRAVRKEPRRSNTA